LIDSLWHQTYSTQRQPIYNNLPFPENLLDSVTNCIPFLAVWHSYVRARAHERLDRNGFFTAGMKRSVLNASEPTDGCFTAAFFQTQHASFSVLCGGRTAVGGGNGTRKNIPA
jgi:hypothetical protein